MNPVLFADDYSESDGESLNGESLVVETSGESKLSILKNAIKHYWTSLLSACGWRFLLFLVASQLLGKGALMTTVRSVMLPLFKDLLHVNAQQLQIYVMIVMIPWSVKPLIGICSDYILIGGYNKRGWLLIGSAVGILFSALLFASSSTSSALLGACFTGINFQVALYDLLSEAKYSEIRNEHIEIGSNLTTLVQGMQVVGVLITIMFVGALADERIYTPIFIIALCLSISMLIPTLLGWLPEVRHQGVRFIQIIDLDRLRSERYMIMVVAFCGASGLISSLVVTLANPTAGLIVALLLLICCISGCWAFFPAGLTQVALYQVFTTLSQPAMGAALDYYYTANADCLPDGPHFSYAYYIGYAGIVGTLISLAGVGIYQVAFSQMRFRTVLSITTILASLGGISDLIIVLRWNIAMGIPDKVAYIVGEAVLEPLLGMLNWIPASALISITAPKGMEASCFAFMAGLSNFARMVSELSGSILFTAAGINTTSDDVCNFDSMWWLVLMCHIVMPIAIGIPSTWFIPNIKQDERL